MSKYQKKNMLIGGLLAIVVLMGIAYAAFASNLTITGSGSVSSNWCIGFDSTRTNDYQATAGKQGGTTPTGSMSFDGQVCSNNYKTNASLNASFIQPGDKIEYTLTIGNKGTLAAAIESINVDNQSVTSDTTITKGNIKYIIEMPETTSLAVNATTTMKVTAMFQNDTEVTSSTNEQQTISISINAVQDDGNGGFTPTGGAFTGTIYRFNSCNLLIGDNIIDTEQQTVTSGEDSWEVCRGVGEYTTDASTINKNYYLKHDVTNDIVTASYVCFVYNNAEHCLKGGDNGVSFAANTQTIQDFQTFNNLGPYSNGTGCRFSSSSSSCNGGGFDYVRAGSDGYVEVNGSSSEDCYVTYDGNSSCFGQ